MSSRVAYSTESIALPPVLYVFQVPIHQNYSSTDSYVLFCIEGLTSNMINIIPRLSKKSTFPFFAHGRLAGIMTKIC